MKILITGGDHTGKDSLARALAQQLRLRYTEPSSLRFARIAWPHREGGHRAWWEQRRENRGAWIQRFNELRGEHGAAVFATTLFAQGEDIVTGLRYMSELIGLCQSAVAPDVIIWCRYAVRDQPGTDALNIDTVTQIATVNGIPVLHAWGPESVPAMLTLLKGALSA